VTEGTLRRVLVAEDEFLIALEIGDALERAGYEVIGPVATASEAERLAREELLDVAVLDIDLQGETVFAAADLLVRQGVPFVILSGYGVEKLPERFRGRPAISKPCPAELLPSMLEAAAREQLVRERAYAIWEREGRPAGEADRHWFMAEAELRS
jgi:DNA-binding NarL/FixJ family response regulator